MAGDGRSWRDWVCEYPGPERPVEVRISDTAARLNAAEQFMWLASLASASFGSHSAFRLAFDSLHGDLRPHGDGVGSWLMGMACGVAP